MIIDYIQSHIFDKVQCSTHSFMTTGRRFGSQRCALHSGSRIFYVISAHPGFGASARWSPFVRSHRAATQGGDARLGFPLPKLGPLLCNCAFVAVCTVLKWTSPAGAVVAPSCTCSCTSTTGGIGCLECSPPMLYPQSAFYASVHLLGTGLFAPLGWDGIDCVYCMYLYL